MRQVGDPTLDLEAALRRTGDEYVNAASDELEHVRRVEEMRGRFGTARVKLEILRSARQRYYEGSHNPSNTHAIP